MKPVYADEDVKRARHEKKNSTVYNPQLKLTCTCTTESGLYRRFVKLNNIKYTIRTLVKPDFSGVTADEWDLSRQTILEFDNFISRVRKLDIGGSSSNIQPASNNIQRQLTSSPVPVVSEEIEDHSNQSSHQLSTMRRMGKSVSGLLNFEESLCTREIIPIERR